MATVQCRDSVGNPGSWCGCFWIYNTPLFDLPGCLVGWIVWSKSRTLKWTISEFNQRIMTVNLPKKKKRKNGRMLTPPHPSATQPKQSTYGKHYMAASGAPTSKRCSLMLKALLVSTKRKIFQWDAARFVWFNEPHQLDKCGEFLRGFCLWTKASFHLIHWQQIRPLTNKLYYRQFNQFKWINFLLRYWHLTSL